MDIGNKNTPKITTAFKTVDNKELKSTPEFR